MLIHRNSTARQSRSATAVRRRIRRLLVESLEDRSLLAVGVSLVQDLADGPSSSHPWAVGTLGDDLYFSAADASGFRALWRTNGSGGVSRFADLDAAGGGVAMGGVLYFAASDGEHGTELWKTDGTAAGTVMVKDIREGSGSAILHQPFVELNGELYFEAYQDGFGYELWKTDGTVAGTVMVKDIQPGAGGSGPRWLTVAGGLVYFTANDGTSGIEVWRSDGTEAGTTLTKDISPGSGNSFQPGELTAMGEALYFRHGNTSTGEELWKSDGSAEGTVLVRDIYPGQTCPPFAGYCYASHSRPDQLTAIGEVLYFSAHTAATGRELYRSDGTEGGTVLVRDINPGSDGIEPFRSNPTGFTALGNFAYFLAEQSGQFGQTEVWKTDGTEEGTELVKDLNPNGQVASQLLTHGDRLYFGACWDPAAEGNSINCEPWTSDGTEAGTTLLHDVRPGLEGSDPSGFFVSGNGVLYFTADDGEHGVELWQVGEVPSLIVTTTADSGPGSLRAAIEFANSDPDLDTISFTIPGDGPHTIAPLSPLPTITEPVVIDGYTQPGTTFNETTFGLDTVLMIELDGSQAGQSHGLVVTGGDSTIRGLAVHSFTGDGIRLESDDNIVAGNFIGTDIAGTLDRGNSGHGIAVISPQNRDSIYFSDFEGAVGSEWSTITTSVTPQDERRFLGELGSETATLTIPAASIPQGTTALTVEFELFVIRTWDGNHNASGSGPDRFQLTLANGLSLIDTTFSNNVPNSALAGQAYPGTFGTGQFDPHTGASEINTLGYSFGDTNFDSVYRLAVTFSYTGGDVALNFTGILTTPGFDESWGLDNVELQAITEAFSAANDFSHDSNPNGAWSFGWTQSLGSAFHLYPDKSEFLEMQFWADHAIDTLYPSVFYNPTDHAIDQGRHLSRQLSMHPGGTGERAVVRWTAPQDDAIAVGALFTGGDFGTTTDVHVLHNGTSLFDGELTALHRGPYFAIELNVVAGDTIDFVVGDGGNGFIGDSTALDAVIYSIAGGDADDNEVGGTSAADRNVIAFNGGDGIHVAGFEAVASVLNNYVFANGGLGIDLAGDGVTLNDEGDGDSGPNQRQNYPVLAEVTLLEDFAQVSGTFAGEPSADYRLEFFANAAADPSGHGEGQRLIGRLLATTDDAGLLSFVANVQEVAAGEWITATATDSDGNTSEFSLAIVAGMTHSADLAVSVNDSPDPVIVGHPVTYTVTVTNHGPVDATGVVVTASAPGSTDFNSVMVPIGYLESGESRSFEITFVPQDVGMFVLAANVMGGEADPDVANNAAAETTVVETSSTIELAAATYEVSEGDEFAVLTVHRSGDLDQSASVEFTTVGDTAGQRGILAGLTRLDDFATTSGTLFFRPRSIVATIRVPIRDDAAVEEDEDFHIVLSNPSANAKLGEVTSAIVTIHDNDPSLVFAAGTSETVEGNGRVKTHFIPVKLSSALTKTVTVTYTVTGGTATVNQDFRPRSGTLTFRPRVTTQSIPLQIIGDRVYELDETVVIELSNPVNAFLGSSTRHRLTITNDDPQPPPADPGSTPATALAIDLQTLPRQTYSHSISRTDVETFRIELGAGEQLILDVDPISGGPMLPSSTLQILAGDGVTVLNTVGASAEPEGGRVTNNPATLFQADADGGTYYVQLSTAASGRGYGYDLHFHRIGVSLEVPHPDLLNAGGSMFAWFDGVDTVGITGPTGYGFTLAGPWQQEVSQPLRGALRSQVLTLPSGTQFTMRSPQGVELPLLANGPIVITTALQRWGNIVGRVTTSAIDFPVALAIAPINDLLADAIGSEFVAFGLLSGQWRISLGANVLYADGRNANRPVEEALAGIPYLRQKGPINFNASLGGISLDYSVIETQVEWIFDPADPMLYVKADKVGEVKEAALAVSLNGLIEFKPQDAPHPMIDAGVTEFYGHIYGTAKVPFKIGPLPMEVEAEIVANVDADRDGRLLGDLRDVDELFDILQGDFSEVREIINDVQLGANGTLIMSLQQKKGDPLPANTYTMEAGRASLVLDGLAETIWVRGQQGGDVLSPPFLKRLNSSASIVTEGLISWNGDFLLSTTTSYSAAGIGFEYGITFSNEGIFAKVRGTADWSVEFDYGVGQVNGKAIAEIEANLAIEFDDDGDVHLSGSISASGRLRFNGNDVFKGSIEASVRSKGFRFRFPRGVGNINLDLF